MGLVATVRCCCFDEGRAALPDFDVHLLKIEPNGRLTLSFPESMDEASMARIKEAKVAWERNCCAHPWRYLENEWIASWRGVRMFRYAMQAIDEASADQEYFFPVLSKQLPLINAGEISAQDCQKALQELDVFEDKLSQGLHQVTILEDVAIGGELYVDDYLRGGCFYIAPAGELWLKAGNFCVVRYGLDQNDQGRTDDSTLFQSAHFVQSLVENPQTGAIETIFTDQQKGHTVTIESDMTIRNVQAPDVVVTALRVISRSSHPGDYAYILKPLRKVLRASVNTGHPLVWG